MKRRITITILLLFLVNLLLGTHSVTQAQGESSIADLVRQLRANGMPDPSGTVLFEPPPFRGVPAPSRVAGPTSLSPLSLIGGTDVRVTTDPAPQNETSITHNPNATSTLVGGANDYRNGDAQCGYYLSTDAGTSWGTQNTLLPKPNLFNAAGDPAVAFDNNGNVYYSCLAFNRHIGRNGIYVYKGTVSGNTLTWSGPAQVVLSNNTATFHDKEYVAVDQTSGTVYVSWTRFENNRAARIVVAGSNDGGATFASPSPTVISDFNSNQGSAPAVAPNGTVYVAWQNFNVQRILVDKSTNGAVTWGTDRVVANITPIPSPLPNTSFRTNSFPTLGVHPTNPDVVYVAWADYGSGNADILFSQSTNGGTNWTTPLRLTGTGCDTCDQFFPWLSVASDGAINIVFYSRIDTTTSKMDVYIVRSTDGGASFSATKVTGVPTDQNDGWGGFIGDYIGVTADSGAVHPLWTAGFKDPALNNANNQDLYTDNLSVRKP